MNIGLTGIRGWREMDFKVEKAEMGKDGLREPLDDQVPRQKTFCMLLNKGGAS
jgi:hypothetical protein